VAYFFGYPVGEPLP